MPVVVHCQSRVGVPNRPWGKPGETGRDDRTRRGGDLKKAAVKLERRDWPDLRDAWGIGLRIETLRSP